MDEVARATSTAFTISNGFRRDTELTILFVSEPAPHARRIRLLGSGLRYLNPDERSTAALLKNALVQSSTLDRDIEASPGLVVGPTDPLATLADFVREPGSLWLSEAGSPYTAIPSSSVGFGVVVSDPDDPTPEERDVLTRAGVPPVSLGPVSLRASQCIDVLHNRWDSLADGRSVLPGGTRA